jgi:hypothetical protein
MSGVRKKELCLTILYILHTEIRTSLLSDHHVMIMIMSERPYLTTKIITLSEFFNFVHQVSRL